MEDNNQAAQPASWLGYKLINQAAADEMGASVLPSDKALSGRVWLALTDSDGDALYVAGIVVAATFTAAAVRYSVAFPVAPQPREGVTMYAVVENVDSSLVLSELPPDETVFDAVLTQDAAALIPVVELVPVPAPIFDSANPLQLAALAGQLAERRDALASLVESDPLAALPVAVEVLSLANQVLNAEPVPVAEMDPTEWPGYSQVLQDEALAVKWQDRLDSFFQGRIVAVRNALRALGWDGERNAALTKAGIIARFDYWQVGAGRNVVGMTVNGIRDDLTLNVDELAAAIDATAALPESESEDHAKLAEKRELFMDMLETNPNLASADKMRAEIERINAIIGAPKGKEAAPKVEHRIAGADEPAYMQAIYDLGYKWATATAEQRMSGTFMGQMKRDVRTAAKRVPESDEKAVLYIDNLVTRVFGGDYSPKMAAVEFAPAVPTPVAGAVAELTGDELGDFPGTPEGNKARREAAKGYFADKLRGTSVFNASLSSNIEIEQNGIKKVLSFSADPRKLKLVPALPSILTHAIKTGDLVPKNESNVKAVYVLKAAVKLGDAELTVRVIVKKRDDGTFFYDHSVNREDLGGNTEILDSVDGTDLSLPALLCPEPSAQQVLLDSVGASGKIFNLFIEGEVPEVVASDEETAPVAATPSKETMQNYIKVAADSLEQLRRIDVYRVLNSLATDNVDGVTRADLATFIATGRPDLVREVTDVMAEEWPELAWALAAPAGTDELLVPNKDGAPKELTVPPIPTEATPVEGVNPARAGDMAFLNSVVSQSVDMWDDALADKIEAMMTAYENDGEMMGLASRAIDSYTDFMLAAA